MKDRIHIPSRLQARIDRLVEQHQKERVETSDEARRAVEAAIVERGVRALEQEAEAL